MRGESAMVVGELTGKALMGVYAVTPSSHISRTLPSNILTSVRPSGRFLVLWPMANIVESFLFAQKSSEAVSSNGLISFFLLNAIA